MSSTAAARELSSPRSLACGRAARLPGPPSRKVGQAPPSGGDREDIPVERVRGVVELGGVPQELIIKLESCGAKPLLGAKAGAEAGRAKRSATVRLGSSSGARGSRRVGTCPGCSPAPGPRGIRLAELRERLRTLEVLEVESPGGTKAEAKANGAIALVALWVPKARWVHRSPCPRNPCVGPGACPENAGLGPAWAPSTPRREASEAYASEARCAQAPEGP